MKLIIAGGRSYVFTEADLKALHVLHDDLCITEVVSGGAAGADRGGEYFAIGIKVPVKRFLADWDKHGKAAGPIRNREMAEYANALFLLPGGRGTASMLTEARRAGILVYDRS